MRYALIIALAVLACRKTDERTNERTRSEGTPGTQPKGEPTTGETPPASPPSGAARATTAPQRGTTQGADESMRPDSTVPKPIAMRIADVKWGDGPPGLPKGVKLAVLEGEPPFLAEKTFTLLLKMPKNYAIPPHTHLVTERVTVLEGVLSVGHGKTMERETAIPVGAGGLVLVPAGHEHYVFTSDQETTVALTGVGPWQIIYVNPKDDPRPTPVRAPAHKFESKWDAPIEAKIFMANDVAFQEPPPNLLPPGVKMAVLEGDPNQPKTYVVRLQFPKGSRMPPHSHKYSERFFVLSGHPKFAFGDTWDEKKLQPMGAPSVGITPPDMAHYARIDDDTVVQVAGVGPMNVKYANPADAQAQPQK